MNFRTTESVISANLQSAVVSENRQLLGRPRPLTIRTIGKRCCPRGARARFAEFSHSTDGNFSTFDQGLSVIVHQPAPGPLTM